MSKNFIRFLSMTHFLGYKYQTHQPLQFLRVILNENLPWNNYIKFISTKVAKCFEMYRLKRFIPLHIPKTLYFTLVHSHLIYSSLAWGFNCRIKLPQTKAIRIIAVSKFNAHAKPFMKALIILDIEDMLKLNILKWYL